MTFTVTGTSDTGAIHTVQCNSATEALSAEDGMIESGYITVEIT